MLCYVVCLCVAVKDPELLVEIKGSHVLYGGNFVQPVSPASNIQDGLHYAPQIALPTRIFSSTGIITFAFRHTTQCSSVRGYAINSPSNIKETQLEGLQGDDKKTSESTSSSADTHDTSQSPKRSPRLELQDLPDLPPFPGKPTLHISPEDITTYLQPLISRQWSVGRVRNGLDEREVLSLNRHFDFKGFNDVMDFVHAVADISREEKARIKRPHVFSKRIDFTVAIFTHTHSAYTFRRLPDGKYESKKVPGLSRRDIRFAIKIEELHERFKAQGHALESVPTAHGEIRKAPDLTFVKMEDIQSKSTNNAMDKASSNAVTASV
ncbi:hypothetical protein AZE42_01599 [Rhizopogon vesiculosus]|uniref:Uncharacterized protein n=1 Tax=Rhizopogon vesiculosus TaxID=180088 RepID=A0A1J8QIQ4_9AGAM|nr:hypothetical protein AZE42_01599 [Rhizopogon vesiculosus]